MKLMNSWISAAANLLAIVAASTKFVPLPPDVEPFREPAIVVFAMAFIACLYFALGGRIAFGRTHEAKPVIAVPGGREAEELVAAIEAQPALKVDENIRFVYVKAEKGGFDANGKKVLESASGVIMTSDFTRGAYPKAYDWLKDQLLRNPMPVGRSYPAGFEGPMYRDHRRIGFDSPEGIVNYASEFLLASSVQQMQKTARRSRRAMTYACGVTVALVIVLQLPDSASKFDADTVAMPLDTAERLSANAAQLSNCLARSATRANHAHCAGIFLNNIGKVIDDSLRIELDDHNANEVMLFTRSRTPGLLHGYAMGADMEEYDVKATGSIAGCAIEHNLAVTWTGKEGFTNAITARRLTLEGVGDFDSTLGELILPDRKTCTFQVVSKTDRKRALHCLPISPSASPGKSEAALCVSRDVSDGALLQPRIQAYFATLSTSVAIADLTLLETPKPAAPVATKKPTPARPAAPRSSGH